MKRAKSGMRSAILLSCDTAKGGKWVTADTPIGVPVMFYLKGSKVADRFIDSNKAADVYDVIPTTHLKKNKDFKDKLPAFVFQTL